MIREVDLSRLIKADIKIKAVDHVFFGNDGKHMGIVLNFDMDEAYDTFFHLLIIDALRLRNKKGF